MSDSRFVNVAAHLPAMAERQPHTFAVVFPAGRDASGRVKYTHLTYRQLEDESSRLASGLESIGIQRGTRTVLMVKPSLDFFALTFALFKVGAVPVLVDPGMGIRNLKQCLAEAEPEAFIGIRKAHVARGLFRWGRKSIRTLVTVGPEFRRPRLRRRGCQRRDSEGRGFFGRKGTRAKAPGRGRFRRRVHLTDVRRAGRIPYSMAATDPSSTAAILFTSGSTGVPKGVVYSHAIFSAQVEAVRATYGIQPGEIDLPTFPLFSLFAPALGMTAIIPDMDASRPGTVDPSRLVEAIENFGITNMFGSPAVIDRLGRHGEEHDLRLPTLRRVISAGAPVSPTVLDRFARMLEGDAQVFTPYGATESLPVCSIGSDEILRETAAATAAGKGVCVGRPVSGMEVAVIGITESAIPAWSEDLKVADGVIGEIVVRGDVVTKEYYNRAESTALAKISDPMGGPVRHRMGDVGYFDDQGRLWFCGRKAHRVELGAATLYTVPCEGVFNAHPKVYRSALVGVPKGSALQPVICVELEKDARRSEFRTIRTELQELGRQHKHTRTIEHFLCHPSFPVDIRHNAKIFREKLAIWAAGRMR